MKRHHTTFLRMPFPQRHPGQWTPFCKDCGALAQFGPVETAARIAEDHTATHNDYKLKRTTR